MSLLRLRAERLRRMYAGGRGNTAARRASRFWNRLIMTGLLPHRWVVLEVAGRRTVQPTRFPLGMADVNGQWYLVSMLGEDCNWVKNVRVAGGQAVLRRRRTRRCMLVEIPVDQRAPVLQRY